MSTIVLLTLGFVSARAPSARPLPEAFLHVCVRALVHLMYRFEKHGLHRLPSRGAALLVCNHVSFIDAFIIAAASKRPIRFVMHHRIYGMPLLNAVFRIAGVIPIAPHHEDPELLERAFDRIDDELASGQVVCIFPEGKVTWDGKMNAFRSGVQRVLERRPVAVVPMGLRGMWGSFFSRRWGNAMSARPRRFWSRISLHCGPTIAPTSATTGVLERHVAQLCDQPKPISSRNVSEMSSNSTSSGGPSA